MTISSPTVEDTNNDDGASQGSQATTNSHAAFLDYLNTPTSTPPHKKSASNMCRSDEQPSATKSFAANNSSSAANNDIPPIKKRSTCESIGDKVDESISGFFYGVGNFCSRRPKTTIAISLGVAIACAMGMAKLNTENRPEKVSEL